MKTKYLLVLMAFFVTLTSTLNTSAQDYTQWHLPEGAKARLGKGSIHEVKYSPDGTKLYVATSIGIWIYDAQTDEELTLHIGRTISISFSPDGQTLASGDFDGVIRLWNVSTGEQINILTENAGRVDSISFSPDGQTLISVNCSGLLIRSILWDVATGEQVNTLSGNISFSPDGQLALISSHRILILDVGTGEQINTLIEDAGWVVSIFFSPDGQTLASGSSNGTIRMWDVNTGKQLHTLQGHEHRVESISFSPDGQTLASSGFDGTIRLWDANTGRELRTLSEHEYRVESVSFSPDGQTLASGHHGGTIRLWDVSTGKQLHTLKGHTETGTIVSFSPNGQILASSGFDGTIRMWDVNTGNPLHILHGHTPVNRGRGFSRNISFSPDGQTLASGSNDETILLWDVNTGEQLHTLKGGSKGGHESVSFSPDGQTLATSSSNTIILWDVNTGNKLRTLTDHWGNIWCVSFSPDGQTLASGNYNGTVVLWELAPETTSNAEITEPTHLPEDVNQVGVVNIVDLTLVASNFGETGANAADVNGDGVVNIVDLTLVAAAFGNTASAPLALGRDSDSAPTRADVAAWLREARQINMTDLAFQRGISVLEQLLAAFTPKETALLPNYPNPFNPETWIPYQLATPADVSISIYAMDGTVVRTLSLGHQPIGMYHQRSRAAYWDGKNTSGESVASGVYFSTLTATRKMLIRK